LVDLAHLSETPTTMPTTQTATVTVPFILAVVSMALIAIIYFLWKTTSTRRGKDQIKSPTATLLAILDPPGATLVQLLRSRAHPNARLQRAFDLHNPFVSGDVAVRQKFICDARRIIKVW
jgi:hypothetical protein